MFFIASECEAISSYREEELEIASVVPPSK